MEADIWEPLRKLEGKWIGTGRGEPGDSTVTRSYEFVLQGRFLQIRSQSIYPPQEKNPKGEVHEELGMFSYDKQRKLFILRQFHVEGFVNQYAQQANPTDGNEITFQSEAIENIAPGWQARESYRFGDGEFWETFELAAPGGDFQIYSRNYFQKTK